MFTVALADGSSWPVALDTLGHFFVDTGRGGRAAGHGMIAV